MVLNWGETPSRKKVRYAHHTIVGAIVSYKQNPRLKTKVTDGKHEKGLRSGGGVTRDCRWKPTSSIDDRRGIGGAVRSGGISARGAD